MALESLPVSVTNEHTWFAGYEQHRLLKSKAWLEANHGLQSHRMWRLLLQIHAKCAEGSGPRTMAEAASQVYMV